MSQSDATLFFEGSCFCGSASFKVEGKPLLSAYCHCTLCQRLNGMSTSTLGYQSLRFKAQYAMTCVYMSGCAFLHGLHYPTQSFAWTHQNTSAIFPNPIPGSYWIIWRCRDCFTFIAAHNISEDKWTVRSAHFRRNTEGQIENWHLIKPTAHIFYGTRMLDVQDDLPKWDGYEYKSARLCVDTEKEQREPLTCLC